MLDDIHICAAVACDEEMTALRQCLEAASPAAPVPAKPLAPPAVVVVGRGLVRLESGAGAEPEAVFFAVEPAVLVKDRASGLNLLAVWGPTRARPGG
jgi:hypothetical protein